MRILLNGEERTLSTALTIQELLMEIGLSETLVAVERNQQIIPRAKHEITRLAEGDEIEVVQFVGGG